MFWCQAASCNWFKSESVYLVVFSCWLSLKRWNCPSCRYPQFLLPTQCLNKPSRDNHRSHQQLLRSILLPVLLYVLLLATSTTTTSIIFCLLFIFIFSERHSQNSSTVTSIYVNWVFGSGGNLGLLAQILVICARVCSFAYVHSCFKVPLVPGSSLSLDLFIFLAPNTVTLKPYKNIYE